MTHLCNHERRTRNWRRHRRGAAMVEALIVVSIFIMGLMGLVFFKDLYLGQLRALRLARASIIAHGMGACEANQPADWLGQDTGALAGQDPERTSTVADGSSENHNASTAAPDTGSESRADSFQFDQLSSDGVGFLNEISGAEFRGSVAVGANSNVPNGQRFESEVRARGFVSCGDPVVRDTGFADGIDRVIGIMGDLMDVF